MIFKFMGCSSSRDASIPNQLENLKALDKNKVKEVIRNAANANIDTMDKLCDYFKKSTKDLNEIEKAWLAFKWMGVKVKYSQNDVIDKDSPNPYSNPKKYAGHSVIYKKLVEAMGLESEKIEGFAKDATYNPEFPLSEPNHMWNAVKLENVWKLVDSGWSSSEGEKNDDFYFCADPAIFIRSHFPDDVKWQLLKEPVSKPEFDVMNGYNRYFYDYGLLSANPDRCVVSSDNEFQCSIKYNSSINVDILSKLSSIVDGNPVVIENGTFIQKLENHFKIYAILNKKGKYLVELYAAINNMKNYKFVFDYRITCDKDSKEEMKFPIAMAGYNETQPVLFEPLASHLKIGDKINFKVKLNRAFGAAIVVGEKWIHLKREENIFEGEAEIDNDDVGLFYTKHGEKNYSQVFKFPIDKDTNNDN